jgi:hypothetical protein
MLSASIELSFSHAVAIMLTDLLTYCLLSARCSIDLMAVKFFTLDFGIVKVAQ